LLVLPVVLLPLSFFFFSSRRRHTRSKRDWSSDVCSSDLVQTLSQQAVLDKLKATEFDYILIDEAHRAAAPSYQRILNHFMPQFRSEERRVGKEWTSRRTSRQS